jgi:hypothetical protein
MHTDTPTPHAASPAHRRASAARRRPLRAVAAIVVTASLAFAACGDDDDDADPGQPVASGGFAPGDMSDVPVPNDAESSGPASSSGGSTTQSYLVDGVSPEQLINDYQQLATGAGWVVQTAAAQSDTDWSLTRTKGTASLAVTTSPANDDQESDQTELSLILTGST